MKSPITQKDKHAYWISHNQTGKRVEEGKKNIENAAPTKGVYKLERQNIASKQKEG